VPSSIGQPAARSSSCTVAPTSKEAPRPPAQVVTLVISYPLAPEHPVPAAPEAALSAYRWLKKQGFENVAVVGESAGGGLALVTLAQIAADKDLPKAVAGVVLSPWTDLSLSGASMTDPGVEDPVLSHDMLADAAKAYLGSADARDPFASPLFESLAGLPPLLIQVGSDEILLDDSVRYARGERCRRASDARDLERSSPRLSAQ
jgi:epsilon-lactone hydrolase